MEPGEMTLVGKRQENADLKKGLGLVYTSIDILDEYRYGDYPIP